MSSLWLEEENYWDTMLYKEVDRNYYKEIYQSVFEVSSNDVMYICAECTYFNNGCTTSYIERKYGRGNTPACSEFVLGVVNNEE